MRTLLQDLRYGARMVRRQPAFSAVVVMTLALAIGANTVIFSFANILLLRPLPLRDPPRSAGSSPSIRTAAATADRCRFPSSSTTGSR